MDRLEDLIEEMHGGTDEPASELRSALECAGSCESIADLQANVREAIAHARTLIHELERLLP